MRKNPTLLFFINCSWDITKMVTFPVLETSVFCQNPFFKTALVSLFPFVLLHAWLQYVLVGFILIPLHLYSFPAYIYTFLFIYIFSQGSMDQNNNGHGQDCCFCSLSTISKGITVNL